MSNFSAGVHPAGSEQASSKHGVPWIEHRYFNSLARFFAVCLPVWVPSSTSPGSRSMCARGKSPHRPAGRRRGPTDWCTGPASAREPAKLYGRRLPPMTFHRSVTAIGLKGLLSAERQFCQRMPDRAAERARAIDPLGRTRRDLQAPATCGSRAVDRLGAATAAGGGSRAPAPRPSIAIAARGGSRHGAPARSATAGRLAGEDRAASVARSRRDRLREDPWSRGRGERSFGGKSPQALNGWSSGA